MQKKRKIFAFLSLFVLIVIHSCKTSDSSPPMVFISAPSENQIVDAGDTIKAQAQITDNENISYWEVRLANEQFAPLGEVFSDEPNTTGANINVDYPLPSNIAPGTYYIRFRADDDEATTNQYVKLNVNASQRNRVGLVAVVENGGQYSVKYWLNGGTWILLDHLGSNFGGSGFSSQTQQFVTGDVFGDLSVYDLTTGQLAYTKPCAAAPGFPCIQAVASDGQYNYMALEEGRIRRYTREGALSLDAGLLEFRIPQLFYFQDNRIFIFETERTGSSTFWTSYNGNNGVSIQEHLLPGTPVAAFSQGPGTTLMFLNSQAGGAIRRYQFDSNGFEASLPGPSGPILSAAAKNPNQFFFSQPDGIYSLNYSTSNILLFKASTEPQVMTYDDIGDELVVGDGAEIIAYSASSGDLNYSTTPGGNVVNLFVWYTE